MLDEEDSGTRTGVWVALGVVFFVLTGLIGGLVLRQMHSHADAKAGTATAAVAAPAASASLGAEAAASAVGAAASAAVDVVADAASAAGAVAEGAAAAAAQALALIDAPLTGELEGTVYFGSGKAVLPADAKADVAKALKALAAAKGKKLVLSGFHDASGDPAQNAQLAKERAIAVREALIAGGADPAAAVQLRKPESTTGGGDAKTARRVELRLVD